MRANILLAGAAISFMAIPAFADSYSSPWIFSVNVGTEVPVEGDVISATNSNSLTLSTLNSNLTGTGILEMRGRKFKDMYDPALKVGLEVRYALSDLTEIYGSLSYLKAKGKDAVDMGCITLSDGSCGGALTGALSDMEQYVAELGYRQWLGTGFITEALRPYFAIHGGVTYNKAITSEISTGTNAIGKWKLYDEGYIMTLGADLGASYTVSSNAEFAAEIGVRYTDKLNQDDSDYGALGMAAINDDSKSISVPVNLRFHTAF